MTIVGARPQFIKAAATSAAVRRAGISEVIVHTGQHYDQSMSEVFFNQMGIPHEDYNLGVGSGSHAYMTAAILQGIERLLEEVRPDAVLVFGDTNSTMAGALAAAKMHVPVGHVEAGMRSFNRLMPEEINRVMTDHIATWHYCSTQNAADNLVREGITSGIEVTGDVMTDAVMQFSQKAVFPPAVLADADLQAGRFITMTCHRAENTDDMTRLASILAGIARISASTPVVYPVHPRTLSRLTESGLCLPTGVIATGPLSYLDMLALMKNSAAILTDSGGIQKEAYLLGVPCVTMRDETEWIETVESGWNALSGADADAIAACVEAAMKPGTRATRTPLFGDGHAADRIAAHLLAELTSSKSTI